jgi:AbiV family abortive infection protein
MNNLSIEQLQEAYDKIYNNAQELLKEAKLLFDNNMIARSFTLSHLAYEELAKLPMVYYAASSVYFGKPVDWKSFRKRFQNHEEKLRNAIYLLHMVTGHDIDKNKYEEMEKLIKVANDLKNQSLYTGYYDNKFQQPSECVSRESAEISYEMATRLLKFFSEKQLHGTNNIVLALKNYTEKDFEVSNQLSERDVAYTKDGRIFPYYSKRVNQMRMRRKKRSRKRRKKK